MTLEQIENIISTWELDVLVALSTGWRHLTETEREILLRFTQQEHHWISQHGNIDRLLVDPSGNFRLATSFVSDERHALQLFKSFAPDRGWSLMCVDSHQYGNGWFVADANEYDFISKSGKAADTPELAIAKAVLLDKAEK